MSRPFVRAACIVLLSFVLAACAGGSVDDSSDAGSPDTGASDNVSPNNQTTPMMDASSVPDTDDPCGICCPGDVSCVDGTTVGVCNSEGTDFDTTACTEGDVCEEGACTTPPVCMPGETSCFDDATLLTCRGTADGYTTSPCPGDAVCYEGACVSGNPTGATCMTDDECASGQCHCGSGTDENCPSNATPGYCTRPCTNDDDCGANAYCMDGDLVPLGSPNTNYDHCAPSCAAVCADPAFGCIKAPHTTSAGELSWDDTCFFEGIGEIGDPCTSDGACIGECMEDYINDGYCSRRCDNDGSCPSGSACVELRAGEYWCSLLCGNGSIGSEGCPRDSANNLSVSCNPKRGLEPMTVFEVCSAN